MLLLVLGLSYLTLIQSDMNYLGKQERGMRAYYLARAGLDYYIQKNYVPTMNGIQGSPILGTGSSPPFGPIVVEPNETISLSIRPGVQVRDPKDGVMKTFDMVVSKGVITNSAGTTLASRTLMAPKVGPPLPPFSNLDAGPDSSFTVTDHMGLDRGRIYEIYDDSL